MDEIDVFLRVCLLGFSLILTVVSMLSLRRARGLRLVFASGAFLVFLLEGIFLSMGIFLSGVNELFSIRVIILFNLAALVFFYGSLAK